MFRGKRVSLVLGGGGMRGLAHIGVLKALDKFGIVPDEYIGTSVGAFIAAMAAGGMTPEQVEEVGRTTRAEHLIDYNVTGLARRRTRTASIYRGKALHDYVRRILLEDRFDRLKRPLYVTAVNLDTGEEVVWGMPGFTELPVHDAVVSSCAIPGVYPPKAIAGAWFVDGGVADAVPVKVAVYNKAELVVAVYLDNLNGGAAEGEKPAELGAAAIISQAQGIFSRTLFNLTSHRFKDAPLVWVRVKVSGYGLFDFEQTHHLIRIGELEAARTFREHPLVAAP